MVFEGREESMITGLDYFILSKESNFFVLCVKYIKRTSKLRINWAINQIPCVRKVTVIIPYGILE